MAAGGHGGGGDGGKAGGRASHARAPALARRGRGAWGHTAPAQPRHSRGTGHGAGRGGWAQQQGPNAAPPRATAARRRGAAWRQGARTWRGDGARTWKGDDRGDRLRTQARATDAASGGAAAGEGRAGGGLASRASGGPQGSRGSRGPPTQTRRGGQQVRRQGAGCGGGPARQARRWDAERDATAKLAAGRAGARGLQHRFALAAGGRGGGTGGRGAGRRRRGRTHAPRCEPRRGDGSNARLPARGAQRGGTSHAAQAQGTAPARAGGTVHDSTRATARTQLAAPSKRTRPTQGAPSNFHHTRGRHFPAQLQQTRGAARARAGAGKGARHRHAKTPRRTARPPAPKDTCAAGRTADTRRD